MKKSVLFFQAGLCFLISFLLFMGLGLLNIQGSGTLLQFLIFQVVYAIMFAMVSLLVCGICGLPIRLSETWHQWWIAHAWLGPAILLAGLACCVLPILPAFRQELTDPGSQVKRILPHPYLAMAGWALSGFGALHWYPGKTILQKIERWFQPISKRFADK